MIRPFAVWPPAASMATSAPFNSSIRSRSGMAAISFDPSGTATGPRVRRFSAAHAVTIVRQPVAVFRGAERAALPSMAMGVRPVPSHAAAIHRPKAVEKAVGAECGEHAGERVGTGDAAGEGEEAAEERLLGAAVGGDVPRVGPGQDAAGGQHQDVGPAVPGVRRLAAVDVADGFFPLRVGDRVRFTRIDETEFRHLAGKRLVVT